MNPLSPNHFIFTPENPRGPMKYGQNPPIEDVASFLNDQGERAEIVDGHYGMPERSILIHNPKNINGLKQLAQDFGQESCIHSQDGEHKMYFLHGPDAGKTIRGKGTIFSKEEPDDNYTIIHSAEGPLYFTHLFDFNKSEALIKAIQPNQKIRDVADQYAKTKGLKLQHGLPNVKVDPVHAKNIANAYEAMPHNPNHPDVKHAYDSLINETTDQFQHIKNSGLRISKIPPDMENPYKAGSQALFDDINKNNHMWYYPTESGYGNDKNTVSHPLLAMTNEKVGGTTIPANDLFRIVHDYFGHAKEGNGFGPNGEERAWQIHKQMFSPAAQKALTSETRGQNSWVNFGPHGESNRANPDKTIYAEQKAGLMPDWVVNGEKPLIRSESLNKIQFVPGKKTKHKQIRLDEGANAGKIADVVNEDSSKYAIQMPTNEEPLFVLGPSGKPILQVGNSPREWDKKQKHAIVREAVPSTSDTHILESTDVHPFMPHSAQQKKLVHGIDLNKIKPTKDGWTAKWGISGSGENANGIKSQIKSRMPASVIEDEEIGDEYEQLTTAQREGLFHNLAHMMGLGKYVPTTSVVYDNVDPKRHGPSGNHYSVMEMIPNAEHYNEDNPEHENILNHAKEKGDVDKLAIMNILLGNTDRHGTNWMVSPKGIHMIDHGLTFDFHGESKRRLRTPKYFLSAYKNDPRRDRQQPAGTHQYEQIPAHPEALKWLLNLNPNDFTKFFQNHKVGEKFSQPLINALLSTQQMVRSKQHQNVSTVDIMRHIRSLYPTGKYGEE